MASSYQNLAMVIYPRRERVLLEALSCGGYVPKIPDDHSPNVRSCSFKGPVLWQIYMIIFWWSFTHSAWSCSLKGPVPCQLRTAMSRRYFHQMYDCVLLKAMSRGIVSNEGQDVWRTCRVSILLSIFIDTVIITTKILVLQPRKRNSHTEFRVQYDV